MGKGMGMNQSVGNVVAGIALTTSAVLAFPQGAAFALQSADLSGITLFPADNPWHYDISKFPVHPNSANLVASVGTGTSLHPDFGTVYAGAPFGIPYIVVDKSQAKIPVT